jgi:hypothetical protein
MAAVAGKTRLPVNAVTQAQNPFIATKARNNLFPLIQVSGEQGVLSKARYERTPP